VISNPFIQLFVGDILQVIPLAFTSFLPWGGVSVRRFVYFLRSQFISNTLPLPVGDTPTFFEADELTFSSVIIFEPVLVSLLGAVPAGSAPYLTHRLYNWKYIT
jgi:hypothetical protein